MSIASVAAASVPEAEAPTLQTISKFPLDSFRLARTIVCDRTLVVVCVCVVVCLQQYKPTPTI